MRCDDVLTDEALAASNRSAVQAIKPQVQPVASSPPTQEDEVSFISGLTSSGTLAATSFATWNNDSPASYANTGEVDKWTSNTSGTSTAGTPGGTVYYYFDPKSDWTATEQAGFTSGLSLWSAETNISFTQTTDPNQAQQTFVRGGPNDGAYEYTISGGQAVATGSTTFVAPTSTEIVIDTTEDGFGQIGGSFSYDGGYSYGTLVHEEGHLLGLGHAGPYNGDDVPKTEQFSPYDNYQFSLMSYIDPQDTSAKYYADNPVPGTSLNGNSPTTPMLLDIEAAQRLYGAPVGGPLSGGQVFGYDTNITGDISRYFDFTVNTTPVVTLFDTGTGNTLNLSGCTTACTVNLNPGTFSSFDSMTNNMAIDYHTAIDVYVGGSGDDTITVNGDSDTIDGGAGTNDVVFSGDMANYTIVQTGTSSAVVTKNNIVDQLKNVKMLTFDDSTVTLDDDGATAPVCFATGTRIGTVRGDIAVEHLRVGDLAVTSSGGHRPITWLGHRTVDCRSHPRPHDVYPVRIATHAFGDNRPAADLFVSPGHAICVDVLGEMLMPAGALVNGSTVTQVEVEDVTYWHVELDSHDVIFAENLPAESYIEMGNRGFFAEADVVDFAAGPDADAVRRTHADFCRPFVGEGPVVDAVFARLRQRAETLGWRLRAADLGGLRLVVDGTAITPDVVGLTARFVVPAIAETAWLCCDAVRPIDVLGTADARPLGVRLRSLTIDDGRGVHRDIDAADGRLCVGFHSHEAGLGRWTTGRALLPRELWEHAAGPFLLRVDLAGPALPRWIAPDTAVAAMATNDEEAQAA